MDLLTDVILAGFAWDIIKKLLSQGVDLAIKLSGMLFESVNYATNLETCKQIASRAQSLYSPNQSFSEYVYALQNDKEYMNCVNFNINYKTEFAKRLDYFISLTNVNSTQKINIEKIAEYIGLRSAYGIRKYYLKERDPKFVFIEEVAEKLGINREWLKNGLGEMITPKYKSFFAMDCYENINKDTPQTIFFCLSDQSRLGIVCQINRLRFHICDYTWHFNSTVGSTGKSQIESIYWFIKNLSQDHLLSNCEVLFFPNEFFDKIFECKVPPSAVSSLGKRKFNSQCWLEDFISLKPTNEYGGSFKYCQDVVRERISNTT